VETFYTMEVLPSGEQRDFFCNLQGFVSECKPNREYVEVVTSGNPENAVDWVKKMKKSKSLNSKNKKAKVVKPSKQPRKMTGKKAFKFLKTSHVPNVKSVKTTNESKVKSKKSTSEPKAKSEKSTKLTHKSDSSKNSKSKQTSKTMVHSSQIPVNAKVIKLMCTTESDITHKEIPMQKKQGALPDLNKSHIEVCIEIPTPPKKPQIKICQVGMYIQNVIFVEFSAVGQLIEKLKFYSNMIEKTKNPNCIIEA
jgi:hypothetical protein